MKLIKEQFGYQIFQQNDNTYVVDDGYSKIGSYKTLKGAERSLQKTLQMAGKI